jgi:cytochrome c-type biogenesis protein CcmH
VRTAALGLALWLAATAALGADSAPDRVLEDPAQEARARALQTALRCVVCQGQSIADSNAPLAADMRNLIREQIAAGRSDDEIKSFLVARYGEFVLMEPPLRGDTLLLWFAPALLVLVGGGIIAVTVLRARRRADEEGLEAGGTVPKS